MPFFLDDGTQVKPEDLVIPNKCFKCKLFLPRDWEEVDEMEVSIQWEERVMCILSRIGYLDQKEFVCHDYIYNPKWKSKIN